MKAITQSDAWSVVRETPIGRAIRKVYWLYKLNVQTTTSSVGAYEASFVTGSIAEYNRINSFVGEAELIQEILTHLDGDERYWDIGANVGTHSVFPCWPSRTGALQPSSPSLR